MGGLVLMNRSGDRVLEAVIEDDVAVVLSQGLNSIYHGLEVYAYEDFLDNENIKTVYFREMVATAIGVSKDYWIAQVVEINVREPAEMRFIYKNHRGEVEERHVRQVGPLWRGTTEWHKEEQWFMTAWDYEKQAFRDFAVKDIQW